MTPTRNGAVVLAGASVAAVLWLVLGYRAAAGPAIAGPLLLGSSACWLLRARPALRTVAGGATVTCRPVTVVRGGGLRVAVGVGGRRIRARVSGPWAGDVLLRPGTTARLNASRRGRHPIRVARLIQTDPMGLLRQTGPAGPAEVAVTVLPRCAPFPAAEAWGPGGPGGAGPVERGADAGTVLATLREYVPGDDVRRIQWAAGARTVDGDVLVRHDVLPGARDVLVVLDPVAGPGFETSVDVAFSVVLGAAGAGCPVHLLTAAPDGIRRVSGVRAAVSTLLTVCPAAADGLAGILGHGNYAAVPPGGSTILVTAGAVSPAGPVARLVRDPAVLIRISAAGPHGASRHGRLLTLVAPGLTEAAALWTRGRP